MLSWDLLPYSYQNLLCLCHCPLSCHSSSFLSHSTDTLLSRPYLLGDTRMCCSDLVWRTAELSNDRNVNDKKNKDDGTNVDNIGSVENNRNMYNTMITGDKRKILGD